jgi:hypothetical protein
VCENPATFRVGEAKRIEIERETVDLDTLEPTTVHEEWTQGTVLTCAVHLKRAKERWKHHERVHSNDYPTTEEV